MLHRYYDFIASLTTYNILMADSQTQPLISEEIVESAEFRALVVESARM
jgi:hypothetical protein